MNLIEFLYQVKDFRRQQGQRFALVPLLLIVIMSIMTGNTGYREIERFALANQKIFIRFFKSRKKKLPSYVTYREVIKGLDFESVLTIFHQWAQQYVKIEKGEMVAMDGKSLNSTVTDYSDSYQNFVSMVSIFSHKQGQVLKMAKLENKKSSEIPTVRELIKALELKGITFTLDALHCQKKR